MTPDRSTHRGSWHADGQAGEIGASATEALQVGGSSWSLPLRFAIRSEIRRYDYRLAGRRHTLTIGQYPLVSLKEARESHTDARRAVDKSDNPALTKRVEKRAAKVAAAKSFRDIAERWIDAYAPQRSTGWRNLAETWLKNDVYPVIGDRPVKEVSPADVLDVMRRFEARGARTSAERIRSMLSQIFRMPFAICGPTMIRRTP